VKYLVVLDGTENAAQNLYCAIEKAQGLTALEREKLQFKVAILKLLPENIPLDDYMVVQERGIQRDLDQVRRRLDRAGLPEASLEVWPGMEVEATLLVAQRTQLWQADLLFISLGQPCEECSQPISGGWFGVGRRKGAVPAQPPEPVNSPIYVKELMEQVNCRVAITCHGQAVMTLYICYSPVVRQSVEQYHPAS
jgi:nucleotide-binding universal stress UspA family protein